MAYCDGCELLEEGRKCVDCTELEFGAYALNKELEKNRQALGCNDCKKRGTENCPEVRLSNADGPTCKDFSYCGSTLITTGGWDV
jgi:hypothetical protein